MKQVCTLYTYLGLYINKNVVVNHCYIKVKRYLMIKIGSLLFVVLK